jgi:Zn-dependent peptidase ImmA (M78 family)
MEETKEKEKYGDKPHEAKPYTKEEVDLILKQVDEKLQEFLKEGKYKDVLLMMGNLGRYSLINQIYVLLQKPDATTVNGMRQWNWLGRSVVPGQRAIKIFAPIRETVTKDELDENGKPVLDADGKPVKEAHEVVRGFKPSYVFDVSQTQGKDPQAFKFDEKKTVESKKTILEGLAEVAKEAGYTISHAGKEELGEGVYGLCNTKKHTIQILDGMSDLQEISTTVHECGHALAHTAYRKDFAGLTPRECRKIKEVEAESIACVVCSWLGLDTENFNFSYITGWAEGDLAKFHKNMDVISSHANTIIGGIDRQFAKERIKAAQERKASEAKAAPAPMRSNPSRAMEGGEMQ